MTNRKTNRKYITRSLICECTPKENCYIGEHKISFAFIQNIQLRIGKPLTHKQLKRIVDLRDEIFLMKTCLS